MQGGHIVDFYNTRFKIENDKNTLFVIQEFIK